MLLTWGFNPYVKFKLKPTGIMKKYCKNLTVGEYKRRCNTIENIHEVLCLRDRVTLVRETETIKN